MTCWPSALLLKKYHTPFYDEKNHYVTATCDDWLPMQDVVIVVHVHNMPPGSKQAVPMVSPVVIYMLYTGNHDNKRTCAVIGGQVNYHHQVPSNRRHHFNRTIVIEEGC